MRLGVYCDYSYRVDAQGAITAELPFSIFVEALAAHFDALIVIGREDTRRDPYPYPVVEARLVGLPHYGSGADVTAVMRTIPAAIRRFWRALDTLDVVWILGPNPPQAIVFALLARLRRRRVVLGVRQNLPELIRHRRPNQRLVLCAAVALELTFRALARRVPVVVVGPDLARLYRHGRSVHTLLVSLLKRSDLLTTAEDARRYDEPSLVMLSVGRLDPEKNPVLLADVLAGALSEDPRWRLEVCGDGPLADALRARADELGVGERMLMHGYVPIDGGLWDYYRRAHALVHVSMTEGVPQVILEAFAARLPVVATAVGGVGALVTGAGLLAAPGDALAAAGALNRLVADPGLRARLTEAGSARAGAHTMDAECSRVAGFLSTNS